jgi:hypothetical protein
MEFSLLARARPSLSRSLSLAPLPAVEPPPPTAEARRRASPLAVWSLETPLSPVRATPTAVPSLHLDARPSPSAIRRKVEDDPKLFLCIFEIIFDSICEFYNYCIVI